MKVTSLAITMKKDENKSFTGFRHSRRSKSFLAKEARKRGWSVSQLVERITDEWIAERK